MKSETNRYNSLDFLKCICAFLVICIHLPFPGTIGEYIVMFSRIAVPIFFMITGFFWHKSSKKAKKTIKKLFYLTISANILYIIFNLLFNKSFTYYNTHITVQTLIKFLIFNDSPFGSHLWYLTAILYTTIIIWLLDKTKIKNKLIYIVPLLLVIDLVFGKYSLLIFKKEFPVAFIRNFIFVGVPNFIIGQYIYIYIYKLKKISLKYSIALLLILITLNCIERFILTSNSINGMRDQYICTTFIAINIFIIALKLNDNIKISFFTKVGCNYSMMIYVIHPIVIKLINIIIGESIIYRYIGPIIVFLISLLITYLYYLIKNRIKKKV